MQAVLPVLLWPEHCPGERDTHSWLPLPHGGRAGGTVQCHLLCQDEGNWDWVAVTGRIHAADGGALVTVMLSAQKPWLS